MGSVDPTSGRFSGVAKCSWLVTPGQPDAFVPEFAVSGDLFTLIASNAGLTARRELIRGEVLCPGILIGDGLVYGATSAEREL
jgi:predicted Zn-dependent protease